MAVENKVLYSVLQARRSPWLEIYEKGQLKTWMPEHIRQGYPLIQVYGSRINRLSDFAELTFNFFSSHKQLKIISNLYFNIIRRQLLKYASYIPDYKIKFDHITGMQMLEVSMLDIFWNTRTKVLATLNYFLSHTEYSHILLTTSSSYLRSNIIHDLLVEKNNLHYGGTILEYSPNSQMKIGDQSKYKNQKFASGAFRIFSREFAKLILREPSMVPIDTYEDVAFGVAAQKLGIELTKFNSFSIQDLQGLNDLTIDHLLNNYHFRLKSIESEKINKLQLALRGGAGYSKKSKRNDVALMEALHKKYEEIGNHVNETHDK